MTTIVVTAAVIERKGRFLITRRLAGTHLAGLWEFPGGKCEPGETHAACLAREIEEELGVRATVGAEILSTTHTYPDRQVELHFLQCRVAGTPRPLAGQEMRWAAPAELQRFDFPPADAELIGRLSGDKR